MKVLTIGTFDILHEGHIQLLNNCSRLSAGGSVIVGLNSDRFVKQYKGQAPVVPYTSRSAVLRAIEAVDEVEINDDAGHSLIKRVRPSLLVIGTDWAKKDYYKQIGMSAADLKGYGILLVYVPYTEGISTTILKESL